MMVEKLQLPELVPATPIIKIINQWFLEQYHLPKVEIASEVIMSTAIIYPDSMIIASAPASMFEPKTSLELSFTVGILWAGS